MAKRDIDRIIEQQGAEEKQALYERLNDKLNIEGTERVKPKLKKTWVVFVAVLCACVLCLAVVLPVTLVDKAPQNRFCYTEDCVEIPLDITLKEYAEQNNLPLLYLDWYDVSDVYLTSYCAIDDPTDIIYLEETHANLEIGESYYIYVCDSYTTTDIFEYFHNVCTDKYTEGIVEVHLCCTSLESKAYFEYQGYKYYIEILGPDLEYLLREIVSEMLSVVN